MIMNRYEAYCIEDFVLDAEFQNWVRYKTAPQVAFWNDYLLRFPAQAIEISEARTLLEGIYLRYGSVISDDEIDTEITGLITRIREDREQKAGNHDFDQSPVRSPLWVWLAAASVLIALGFAGWYGFSSRMGNPTYAGLVQGKSLSEKVNNTNSKQTIVLPDGSTVVLEPNARLSNPPSFASDKREVYLSGEAYFKVSKDIKRPFLVYTQKLVTRVLGTRFIVKAMKDAGEISVEVKEGKVSVFRKDDFDEPAQGSPHESKGIVVTPNQKLVLESDGTRMLKKLSEEPAVIPGIKVIPKFDYNNTPIRDVLRDLKQAYQVDIIFDADLLSDCPITASLSTQPLLKKLDIICEAIEAKYEVLDGQIIIYGKSCLN